MLVDARGSVDAPRRRSPRRGEGAARALPPLLAGVAIWDLTRADAVAAVDTVAAGLADLAGAALEAALHLARRTVGRAEGEPAAPGRFPAAEVAATRLAVIGMGKAGARELNYVSDVDVIFVAESADEGPSRRRARSTSRPGSR